LALSRAAPLEAIAATIAAVSREAAPSSARSRRLSLHVLEQFGDVLPDLVARRRRLRPASARNRSISSAGRLSGMPDTFGVGDLVRKRAGYEYPGVVVSVFTTRAGAVRYVVEADHPAFVGMLHIFSEEQLERRPALAVGERLPVAKF
jgi:hypothetical protein